MNALQGGSLSTLPPSGSTAQIVTVVNDIVNRLNNLLQTQVFSDSKGQRYIQGYAPKRWPGGDYGIAISPPGVDVLSCDFSQLLFAWDFTTNNQYFNGGLTTYSAAGSKVLQVGTNTSGSTGFGFDDAANERFFLGKKKDGSYIGALSKQTFDAQTATPNQVIWSLLQDMFKIVQPKTTITIPSIVIPDGATANGVDSFTVTHNLGFYPIIFAFTANGTPVPGGIAWNTINVPPGIVFEACNASISLQNVTPNSFDFQLEAANINYGSSGYTYPATDITFYLLQESAS